MIGPQATPTSVRTGLVAWDRERRGVGPNPPLSRIRCGRVAAGWRVVKVNFGRRLAGPEAMQGTNAVLVWRRSLCLTVGDKLDNVD